MLRDHIENNLSTLTRLPIEDKTLERAAVVVAIMDSPEMDESPCFLLTRRASKMRKHAGQFALPGGKIDAGESAEQAALRELQEELGITVNGNDILGVLDDYPTRSGFCITPLVVWVEQVETITPNPDEVDRVFKVPFEDLRSEELINLDHADTPEQPVFSINLATVGHDIYAPTAAIIYQFYEVAIRGNKTRVAFYDEPAFAWK